MTLVTDYPILGLIYAVIFFIMWVFGFCFSIIMIINATRLKNYIWKKYPNINLSIFIYHHKNSKRKFSDFPKEAFYLIKAFLTFGSKKAVEDFLNIFMEINKLKKLNDKKITILLNKLVSKMSLFIKIFIIMFISFFIVYGY